MGWTNKCKPFRDEALYRFQQHWSSVNELDETQCADLREVFGKTYLREKAPIFEEHFNRGTVKLPLLLGVDTTRDCKQLIASSATGVVRARYYWPCSDRPIGFEV